MANATAASVETAPIIQLSSVSKWFGTFQALRNVNLDVERGQKVVVCVVRQARANRP